MDRLPNRIEAGPVRVRIRRDPSRIGITTGKTREQRGRVAIQVMFPDATQYVPEDQLEPVPEEQESPLDLLEQGRLGKPLDLRRVLTHARLSGRLADIIYSMEATNTEFYAYQFKPVIKFLETPTKGILIADEVGLGKTIEAGLIWTELRSRFDLRRLLVVCPAVLREKWVTELRRRMGISARIARPDEVLEEARDPGAQLKGFALVTSMQGMRPRKSWEDPQEDRTGSGTLARFLDENAEEILFDLVVIDEAHYMRNPETQTHELGRLLRDVSAHVLLLSATPVHNRSDDLFSLLRLLDPESFRSREDFVRVLTANGPLVRARDAVLSRDPDAAEIAELIETARMHPLLRNNRTLETISGELKTVDLREPEARGRIAYQIERANMLGHVVTRTRKRDVVEWRVIREPFSEMIGMSQREAELYGAVTDIIIRYAEETSQNPGFLAVTPQRQLSSSIPAAIAAWRQRHVQLNDLDEMEFDENDRPDLGPLVSRMVAFARTVHDIDTIVANDTKYARLKQVLNKINAEHGCEKVVLFSYYRPTLAYLHRRLDADGFSSIVLQGGEPSKDEIIRQFASPDGPQILLSSEVGGEGVDLQFAWIAINYDLPWNPMRIEQRIGRVDRLGQKAEKVLIWNLLYAETVDARIYQRLYEKLDLCRHAFGDFEEILGKEMRVLSQELVTRRLTPEQQEARIDQAAQALAILRAEEERLEREAAHLVAYGDYILQQVRAAREMHRWITEEDLESFVIDHLRLFFPGCAFSKREIDGTWEITLSPDARVHLADFAKRQRMVPGRLASGRAVCRFQSKVVGGAEGGRMEVISQFHPLVRFIAEDLRSREIQLRPAIAARLDGAGDLVLMPGRYILAGARWTFEGAQSVERLVFRAATLDGATLLSENQAELLAAEVARRGKQWLEAAGQVDFAAAAEAAHNILLGELREAFDVYVTEMEASNLDRVEWQEQNLLAHMRAQRERLRHQVITLKAAGKDRAALLNEAKIRKLEERTEERQHALAMKRRIKTRFDEVCVALVEVG